MKQKNRIQKPGDKSININRQKQQVEKIIRLFNTLRVKPTISDILRILKKGNDEHDKKSNRINRRDFQSEK